MENQAPLETLNEIRSIMEKSTRFISLSGLSGVAAGVSALLGTTAAFIYLKLDFLDNHYYDLAFDDRGNLNFDFVSFFVLTASAVLICALGFGLFFSHRKARKTGQAIWSSASKRMLWHLAVPLVSGGVFCMLLFYHGLIGLIAPTTLVFYGLALINAGKFTLHDIEYLGIVEVLLGLISMYFIGYGLLFWAFGFGVLHIIYGTLMYFKYEK